GARTGARPGGAGRHRRDHRDARRRPEPDGDPGRDAVEGLRDQPQLGRQLVSASRDDMTASSALRPPGRCIFCNSLGLTREHMWADWLRNYIPRVVQEHHVAVNTFFPKNPQNALRRRTGDPHSTRIKCVCRTCNNGWMSQLQKRAKPYLVPMLKG